MGTNTQGYLVLVPLSGARVVPALLPFTNSAGETVADWQGDVVALRSNVVAAFDVGAFPVKKGQAYPVTDETRGFYKTLLVFKGLQQHVYLPKAKCRFVAKAEHEAGLAPPPPAQAQPEETSRREEQAAGIAQAPGEQAAAAERPAREGSRARRNFRATVIVLLCVPAAALSARAVRRWRRAPGKKRVPRRVFAGTFMALLFCSLYLLLDWMCGVYQEHQRLIASARAARNAAPPGLTKQERERRRIVGLAQTPRSPLPLPGVPSAGTNLLARLDVAQKLDLLLFEVANELEVVQRRHYDDIKLGKTYTNAVNIHHRDGVFMFRAPPGLIRALCNDPDVRSRLDDIWSQSTFFAAASHGAPPPPSRNAPPGFVWTGDPAADQRRLGFVREMESGRVRTYEDLAAAVLRHSTPEEIRWMNEELKRQESRFRRAVPDPNHPGAWIWPAE